MSRKKFKPVINVPVQDLLLDTANARIRHGADQSDCIARILRKSAQMVALMRDIAENGLSTAPILVSPDVNGKFIVRDGNRRVTALKLLSNPGYCDDAKIRSQIESVRAKAVDLPTEVDVLSCDDESVIRREMLLRHSGALAGVGQLNWSAYLRTVFLLNGDGKESDQYRLTGRYLNWAETNGAYVDDDFPISNLNRFFTKSTLALLGFEEKGNELELQMPFDDAKRLALRVLGDIDSGIIKVDDIFTAEAYLAYILGVRGDLGINVVEDENKGGGETDPGTKSGGATGGASDKEASDDSGDNEQAGAGDRKATDTKTGTDEGGGSRAGRGGGSPRISPWDRTHIFPRGNPKIDISRDHVKASSIIVEIKKLNVKTMPFSGCFLLRSLIELSVGHYLEMWGLTDRKALHKNVGLIATHMQGRNVLGGGVVEVVQRHANSEGGLLSVRGLQGYVHSADFHPNFQTINTMWDEIAPFIRLCWVPKS